MRNQPPSNQSPESTTITLFDAEAKVDYTSYTQFAQALYNTGIFADAWLDGNERFGLEAAILSPRLARQLAQVAEDITLLHQELVTILLDNPQLMADFYQLTPFQQMMWESAGGLWHGMARADLFLCTDGQIRCCELNSDTPSGQAEAVVLNQLLHATNEQRVEQQLLDPNQHFGARYCQMLQESLAKRTSAALHRVGIIYPTEFTEDLGMILLFRQLLEKLGITVVTGSPYNLHYNGSELLVLGKPVDLIFRHYKTDWWGERYSVWQNDPELPDPDPLIAPLRAIFQADLAGQVTIVNPFGAVITQNKLSLAFFWEEQARFSPRSQQLIRKLLPETYRLNQMSADQLDQLRANQTQWVLKSDYGCEGAETVCGPFVNAQHWQMSLDLAIPQHFVVQRFFEVQPNEQGYLPNYGVYIIGGSAAGYLTRLSRQSTQYDTLSVPTFIRLG
jgi:glutathionylspermidine synthase